MGKAFDRLLTILIIFELLVLGIVINDRITPRIKYSYVIDDGWDRCSFVDDLDILYYNHTEQIIYTTSCLDFSNHTYEFYLNDELEYTITNQSVVWELSFNITNIEVFPIELIVFDVTLNRTVAIELMYQWRY